MKKVFKLYNSVVKDLNCENQFIEVQNINELVEFICEHWGVDSTQVRFEYNENIELDECYIVKLINKVGETFACIGYINFKPYYYERN